VLESYDWVVILTVPRGTATPGGLVKASCLLRVGSAGRRNGRGMYRLGSLHHRTPSPARDVLPMCARCTALSYRCCQKFDLHLLCRQKLREWLVP
jgi:hypothetical protein